VAERPYIVRMMLRFPRRTMRTGRWRARLAVLVILLGVWFMRAELMDVRGGRAGE